MDTSNNDGGCKSKKQRGEKVSFENRLLECVCDKWGAAKKREKRQM